MELALQNTAVKKVKRVKKHSRNVISREWQLIALTCLIIPLSAFVSPIISLIIVYITGLYLLFKKSNYKFLVFFICFIFIQNITLIVFADKFTTLTNGLFSLGKEIMLYLFVLKNFFSKKVKRLDKRLFIITIAFVVLVTGSFVLSSASFYAKTISIRQLFLPFVCLYFGFFVKLTKRQKKRLFDLIIYFGIVVAILGLLEFFFIKDALWIKLPIAKYQANKGAEFDLYRGVPLNFYTWDFKGFFGVVVRRLVSIFGDPLITGHYLFMCFALVSLSSFKSKKLLKFLFLITAILTFSKGVLVCLLVFIIANYLARIKNYKRFKKTIFILLVFSLIAFPVAVVLLNNIFPNSSIIIHLNGFINGLLNSSILGEGIGKAGVMVSVKTNIERLTGESYIGVLSSQIGLVGLALYLAFMVLVLFILFRFFIIRHQRFIFVSVVLLASVVLESFFSESSVGIIATGLYFVFVGMNLRTMRIKKVKKRYGQK